jgi:uridine phosphorylase
MKQEIIIAFKLADLIYSGLSYTHKGKKVSTDTFFYGQERLFSDVPFFSMDKSRPQDYAIILLGEPLRINHAAELAKRGRGIPKPKSAENGKKGGRPKRPIEEKVKERS